MSVSKFELVFPGTGHNEKKSYTILFERKKKKKWELSVLQFGQAFALVLSSGQSMRAFGEMPPKRLISSNERAML